MYLNVTHIIHLTIFSGRVRIACYVYRADLYWTWLLRLSGVFSCMKITLTRKTGWLVADKLTLIISRHSYSFRVTICDMDPIIDENRNVNDWQWLRHGYIDMQNSRTMLRSEAPMCESPSNNRATSGNLSLINVLFNLASLAQTLTISRGSVRFEATASWLVNQTNQYT